MDAQQPSYDSDTAALASTADHLMAAKMFSLACCVMLFYDVFITFGDEVENIWKQRFTFATVLWFMNRYLSPLGYIVVIVSFHDPHWSKSVCNRYVLYPEILKVFTSLAIGVIFTLRLYSLYSGSTLVLFMMAILLLAELAVKIWAFTDGTSVNLPPGLVGCILTGKGSSNDRFVFTWVAELIFDSIVFIATISRTLLIYRRHRHGTAIPLVNIMMRDGIIYFLAIFIANLVTVTLYIVLPPDLKAINASFSTLITSLMVSRLILNLRLQAARPTAVSFPSSQQPPDRALTSTIVGVLGEPVYNDWFDDSKDADVDALAAALGDCAYAYESSEAVHARQFASAVAPQRQIVVEATKHVTTSLSSGASTLHAYTGRPGLDLGDDRELPLLPDLARHRRMLPPSREGKRDPREERRSSGAAWLPPRSWMLDGVEIFELGRPRRSRRRPSTS